MAGIIAVIGSMVIGTFDLESEDFFSQVYSTKCSERFTFELFQKNLSHNQGGDESARSLIKANGLNRLKVDGPPSVWTVKRTVCFVKRPSTLAGTVHSFPF